MLRINIALRAPTEIEDKAIELATQWTRNRECYFALDGITTLPHITLYAPVVAEEKIPHIVELLQKEAATIAPLLLTLKEMGGGQGFVGLEFNTTPYCKSVLDNVLEKFTPLRAIEEPATLTMGKDYRMNFSPGGIQSLEKYGSVGIIGFHPHLTLFRLKDALEGEIVRKKVKWDTHQFTCSKIAVFAMGNYGTCNELIAQFPLTGVE